MTGLAFRKRQAIAALAAGLLAAPAAPAAQGDASTPPRERRIQEFQLFIENDTWSGTDRYYTNGIKFGVGGRVEALDDLLRTSTAWLFDPGWHAARDTEFGLFIGQNMYTPRQIDVAAAQPFDRPWAAWLYLGGVIQRASERTLDTVEIDVGIVGPAALGRQMQTQWHKFIDAAEPLGWSNQIPNEPGILVAYLHKRRFPLGSEHVEAIPHVGATLGTVMTLARAGGILRVGRNMTGFGPDTIEPGGAMLQNTRRAQEHATRRDFEWYGFVGADFRLVTRNMFLDGTLFRNSPGVDSRGYVYDLSAGVVLRYKMARFSATRVRRSEEFATAAGGAGKSSFHSLNLGFEF